MRKPLIAVSLAGLFLAACSSTPAYHEARYDGAIGYSEAQLDTNRYRVEYRLDDDNIGRAQDLALLRAADLTLDRGYEAFEIISRSSDVVSEEAPGARFATQPNYRVTRDCGLLACRTSVRESYTPGAFGTFRTEEETVVAIEILIGDNLTQGSTSIYNAASVRENVLSRL